VRRPGGKKLVVKKENKMKSCYVDDLLNAIAEDGVDIK
jgi:hypothetical protein